MNKQDIRERIEKWKPIFINGVIPNEFIAWHESELDRARAEGIRIDKQLLAENKRLRKAGDKLYEAASYTGREYDGTHRLLSAAAHWLDTRGKSSSSYQAELTQSNKEEV